MELLVVLIAGVIGLGIPIGIVVVLIFLLPKQKSTNGDDTLIAQLREENQRLRAEVEVLSKASER